MTGNLRMKILGRLGLVAVALAAMGGGAAYFIERRAIDQRILSLAMEESSGLATHVEFLKASKERGDFQQARSLVTAHVQAEHIAEGHFVVIEIYDPAGSRLIEAIHPAFAAVEKAVDAEHHAGRPGDEAG